MSADRILTEVAVQQGWNAGTQLDLALTYINHLGSLGDWEGFLRSIAAEENQTDEAVHVPPFTKDVIGQFFGGAYWNEAEYRVQMVMEDDEEKPVVLWVETSDGARIDQKWFTPEEIDGITWMAMTNHGLDAYEDDWVIPTGIDRVLAWVLGDDTNRVVLDQNVITEIGAWLRFATGEETYEGNPDEWEF